MRARDAGFPARPLHAEGHSGSWRGRDGAWHDAGRASGDIARAPDAALPGRGLGSCAANTHLEARPLLPGTRRPVPGEAEPTLEDAAIELAGFASSALTLHGGT